MVLSLIESSNYSSWIFDSGASSHICHDITKFCSHTRLDNKYVTLPNGTRVPVIAIGIVIISPTLTLYNVYYIPSFCVKLVSVNQLIDKSDMSLTFYAKHFFLQRINLL